MSCETAALPGEALWLATSTVAEWIAESANFLRGSQLAVDVQWPRSAEMSATVSETGRRFVSWQIVVDSIGKHCD